MAKASTKRRISGKQVMFIVLMFSLLLNYPVLSIFNKSAFFLGLPLLFMYLFMAWLTIIIILFYLAKTPKGRLK